MSQPIDIARLLAKTDKFINTMHVVREPFSLIPEKEHIGTCIGYSDLLELREEFVVQLAKSVVPFVYSEERQQRILDELRGENEPESGAWYMLLRRSRKKFRPSSAQGQFSELLLCNLLQHYFHAAPLLRKMPITTNVEIERHGADAIHIAREGDEYRIYIGEAKTYNRKGGGLKEALKEAVADVVKKHYKNHRKELDLYLFEEYLPAELETIARQYKDGTLKGVQVHLVCIVTYNHDDPVTGMSADEKLECIINSIRTATQGIKDSKAFKEIPDDVLPRMNYIIFPVATMEDLIKEFKAELGV